MSNNEAPPVPAPMAAALEQLNTLLVTPLGQPMGATTAAWPDIEKAIIPLLGGAFSPRSQRHVEVAFMLAAALAERLRRDLGAFWFQNRASMHGAALGFPNALVVFTPFEAVFEALGRSNLAALSTVTEQLTTALSGQRSPAPQGQALGPAEYQSMFDPGLVQFVAFDPATLEQALAATGDETVRDFEHGFSKLSPKLPEQMKTQVGREVQGAMRRLPGAAPIGDQIARAPQLMEFVVLARAGVSGTGVAPAEFWEQLLLPLLHVGAAESFAELDEDSLAAFKAGADPVVLYVEEVPYRTPAADEDGLLGVFPEDQVGLLDARWEGTPGVRLLRIDPAALREISAGFEPGAVRGSVERFGAACATAAGGAPPAPALSPGQPPLLDLVLALAADLQRVLALVEEKGLILALRYATEAEVSTESLLQDLRRALREPRIVLV